MPKRCSHDCEPGSASRRPSDHNSPAAPLTTGCCRPGGNRRDYIARDNPIRAATFIAELEAKCRTVATAPELYPFRTDLAPGLRMAAHGRYLVLYRDIPAQNAVRIERVLHGARDLPRLI